MPGVFDERRISFVANEIAEAIEQASFGRVAWTVPAEMFSAAFPGGFAALVNQDFIHDAVNFIEWVNMDDHTITSYVDHFAYINPWADAWTKMPSGSVFVAEKHLPARTFADSEYYNDWLLPQGDVLGGVGLKVDASPTDVVFFPVHYPRRYAEVYDDAAAAVSRRLVGAIERAADVTRSLRAEGEQRTSQAAVTGRAWPTLVVDPFMKLCSANVEAEALLAKGTMLFFKNGRISFRDAALHQQVAERVLGLAGSAASAASSLSWGGQDDPTVFSFSRLPEPASFPRSLIGWRRQVLIVMKQLAYRPASLDLDAFGQLYGLTGAEVRLCLALHAGRTLQEAAAELCTSYEAVRTRTKTIFNKTGTRSQSALCALLARYAG